MPLSAEGYRASDMLIPRLNWIGRFATALRELGPYAVIGLAVPGGILILVSVWAFRHRRRWQHRSPRGAATRGRSRDIHSRETQRFLQADCSLRL